MNRPCMTLIEARGWNGVIGGIYQDTWSVFNDAMYEAYVAFHPYFLPARMTGEDDRRCNCLTKQSTFPQDVTGSDQQHHEVGLFNLRPLELSSMYICCNSP